MAGQHTPGPWEWEDRSLYGGRRVILRPTQWGGFAGLHMDNPDGDKPLLKAAPDLLDACEDAIALIEGWNAGATDVDLKRVMGKLNAAIAKAKGEADAPR